MIEQDVINHLKNDTILDGLLSSSATDSKIYPIRADKMQQKNTPFIIYSVSSSGMDEILDEDSIEFKIVNDDYSHSGQIVNRLKILLEINNELRIGSVPISISSNTYYIYSGERTSGVEYQEPDLERYVKVEIYKFRYIKKIA